MKKIYANIYNKRGQLIKSRLLDSQQYGYSLNILIGRAFTDDFSDKWCIFDYYCYVELDQPPLQWTVSGNTLFKIYHSSHICVKLVHKKFAKQNNYCLPKKIESRDLMDCSSMFDPVM